VGVAVEERIEGQELELDPLRNGKRPPTSSHGSTPLDLEALVRSELREPIADLVRRIVSELAREELEAARQELGRLASSLSANGEQSPPALTAETFAGRPEWPQESPRALSEAPAPAPADEAERRCRTCGESKPASDFRPGRNECGECRRARKRREYRRARGQAVESNGSEPELPG
jgi:hypothetical protein